MSNEVCGELNLELPTGMQSVDSRHVEHFYCLRCRNEHERERVRGTGMPATLCRECHNANARAKRRKHSELTDEQRRKANSRAYANAYQSRGLLEPRPCERCSADHAEKHHDDYSKPLDVRWLCRPCHMMEHAQ